MMMGGGGGEHSDFDAPGRLHEITEDRVTGIEEAVASTRTRVEVHDIEHARTAEWRGFVMSQLTELKTADVALQSEVLGELRAIRESQDRRERRWAEFMQHVCGVVLAIGQLMANVQFIRAIALLAFTIMAPFSAIALSGALGVIGAYGLSLHYTYGEHEITIGAEFQNMRSDLEG